MRTAILSCIVLALWPGLAEIPAPSQEVLEIRGKPQKLHLYGTPGNPPAVVSSGDGGWLHLAPHVAQWLAANGYYVVGFDAKAYLSSFTAGTRTLTAEEVPADYLRLVQFASRGSDRKPLLIGVSEGAGLSVLAASDAATRQAVGGVLGLGLPDVNELGWRWRDMIIYITKQDPKEPNFHVRDVISQVSPVPLAAIHATGDEFVPLDEIRRLMEGAGEPKKLWIVQASDHRFSGNLDGFDKTLKEALEWIRLQPQASPH